MASLILCKSLTYENQSFEINVKYDVANNEVKEVKSIWLITHGKQWPVGSLMMHFFDDAINKIIDETDWREVYREMGEESNIHLEQDYNAVMTVNNVFKSLGEHFRPK